MAVRQRLKQHTIDDGENSGGGADPNGKGKNGK
jgi:hypothetical protein